MELAESTVVQLLQKAYQKEVSTHKQAAHLNGPLLPLYGRLDEATAMQITLQAGEGLREMHRLGYKHHDVKVENILFVRGIAKLCDLGSHREEELDFSVIPKAKFYLYEEDFSRHTTLTYRPPEMVDLYLGYKVDGQADVWMLGCVLFMLACGRHPFGEMSKLEIISAQPNFAMGFSGGLEALLRRVFVKNPSERIRLDGFLLELRKMAEG